MRSTRHGIKGQRGEALSLKDGVQATACSASAKFDLDQAKTGAKGHTGHECVVDGLARRRQMLNHV